MTGQVKEIDSQLLMDVLVSARKNAVDITKCSVEEAKEIKEFGIDKPTTFVEGNNWLRFMDDVTSKYSLITREEMFPIEVVRGMTKVLDDGHIMDTIFNERIEEVGRTTLDEQIKTMSVEIINNQRKIFDIRLEDIKERVTK